MKEKLRDSKRPKPAAVAENPPPGKLPVSVSADDALSRIEKLPRDIGWMLLGAGLMSEVIMGLPPFWVLGILILTPQIGQPIAALMQRRAPKLLNGSLDFVHRYLDDLERRYPQR